MVMEIFASVENGSASLLYHPRNSVLNIITSQSDSSAKRNNSRKLSVTSCVCWPMVT